MEPPINPARFKPLWPVCLKLIADRNDHVSLGYGEQIEMVPVVQGENLPDEIVDIQALHDEDDDASPLVVETGDWLPQIL